MDSDCLVGGAVHNDVNPCLSATNTSLSKFPSTAEGKIAFVICLPAGDDNVVHWRLDLTVANGFKLLLLVANHRAESRRHSQK